MENVRYMISDAANIVNVESHVLRYWEEELELQIPRNEMGHRYYTEENIAQFQKIKEWKEQGYQLKAIRMMIHNGSEHKAEEFGVNVMGQRNTVPNGSVMSGSNVMSGNNVMPAGSPIPAGNPMPAGSSMPAGNAMSAGSSIPGGNAMSAGSSMPGNSLMGQSNGTPGNNVIQMNRDYLESEQKTLAEKHNNSALNTVKLEQFQNMMMTIVKRAVEENNQALGKEVGVQVGDRVLKEMNYLMREQDEAEEERFRKLDAAIRTHQKGRRYRKEKKEKKEKEASTKKLLGKEKKLNPNLTV